MTPGAGRRKGMALVLVAGMFWGATGTLQALAPSGAHPLTVGAIRVVLAGLILTAYSSWRHKGLSFLRKALSFPLAVGVAGIMGFQFSFFSALKLTGVAMGTMIAIGASPMMAGLLGAILEKEPLSGRWLLSTATAVLGCSLLVSGSSWGSMAIHWGGICLAFLAAFCYSLMGLGLKRLGAAMDSLDATTLVTGASIFVGLPVLLALDSSWIPTLRGITVAVALGAATMALPICLFTIGLQRIYLRDAFTLSLMEPFTACILSAVVLGERLSPVSLAGAVLIFLGILLLPQSPGNKNGEAE